MTNVTHALNAYTQAKTSAANPLDLVIMLYDGATDFLNKASTAINMKETQTKIKYIDKTMSIIEELLNSLNIDEGGEVAINLQSLYLYMLRELTIANLHNDAEKVRHIESLFKEIGAAWRQVTITMDSTP
ncbi:MAG: flagellar export chaperone FliS [Thermodesulfovibrio sp. RBG_19FT_COMBO_42_12]|nr:MAG: flagellar export chaperone FliS [Thermodesulfovibrio sp. RBG_19FT_COMBO_42_12]HZX48167.1 flagellar export chaperone FliS [Nitrospirota bacterium]